MELDHVFVFVPPGGGALRRALAEVGLHETYERAHPGQGTANVCYAFDNAFLELLWVTDPIETGSEAIRRTGLLKRSQWATRAEMCRFGVAYRAESAYPPTFPTWTFAPSYLPSGLVIPVAEFSDDPTLPMVFQSPGRLAPTAWPPDRQRGLQRRAGFQTIELDLRPPHRPLPAGLRSLDGPVLRLGPPAEVWSARLQVRGEEGGLVEIDLA